MIRLTYYLAVPVLGILLSACAPTSQTVQPVTGVTPRAPAPMKSGQGSALQKQSGLTMIPLNSPNSPISQRTVYFAFNSSQIAPKYLPIISQNAAYLTAHPNFRIKMEGNTDDRGTQAYNMALGQRRVQAVANLLKLQGVNPNQMTLISYGKNNPVCLQQTPACWSQNRRVNMVYPNNHRP